MSAIQLKASERPLPTAEINQVRKNGKVPAELYGHKENNRHLLLDLVDFVKVYFQAGESSLIDLQVGDNAGFKVLVKEVQKDPISGRIEHVDLYTIKMDEELQTTIPLVFIGESKVVKDFGGTLNKTLEELEISCLPNDLVAEITVDISRLNTFDDIIRVADLNVPEKIKVKNDPQQSVASVTPIKVETEIKPEVNLAETEAEKAGEPVPGAEVKSQDAKTEDK